MKKTIIMSISLLFILGCSKIEEHRKVDENLACGGQIAKSKLTELAKVNGLTMESMHSFKTLESNDFSNKCAMIYKTNDLPSPETITYTVTYSDDKSNVLVLIGE